MSLTYRENHLHVKAFHRTGRPSLTTRAGSYLVRTDVRRLATNWN